MRSLTGIRIFLSTLTLGTGLAINVSALPGALDTTFSVDGITQSSPGYARTYSGICGDPDRGYAQAIQKNDGKIVVVSSTADGDVSVQRFTTAGKGDLTFGTSGRVVTDVGEDVTISAVAIQSDGKIVVAGNSTFYHNVILVRYLPTGARDTSFDGDGILLRNIGPSGTVSPIITSMTIQPNGRYLLAGSVFRSDSNGRPHRELALLRFNTNGTLDTTFDTDGIVVTDSPYGTVHQSCNAFTMFITNHQPTELSLPG